MTESASPEEEACQLCGRVMPLTFHHLIPRKLHRRTRFKKHYSKEALNQGVMLCRPCHRAIHRFYDEMTLGTKLNTLEALQTDETIQKHAAWLAKQRRRKG